MTLEELKNQHPALYAQVFDEGKEAGKNEVQSRVTVAAKYLRVADEEGKAGYGKTIQNIACDVLDGKKSVEALETTVAAIDAMREQSSSAAAQGETAELGETPGQQDEKTTENGVINTEADYQAEIRRDKLAMGMEV